MEVANGKEELFRGRQGINVELIPFKTFAATIRDLTGGHHNAIPWPCLHVTSDKIYYVTLCELYFWF